MYRCRDCSRGGQITLSSLTLANLRSVRKKQGMGLSEFRNGTAPACPDAFNLARYVLAAADTLPDKVALEVLHGCRDAGLSMSFRELRNRVLATAEGLRSMGVGPGDQVLLRLGNDIAFPLAFLSCAALGAIPVATAAALTTLEFERLRSRLTRVALIVSDDSDLPVGPVLGSVDLWALGDGPPGQFADTRADDPAYIVFTSGSSGQPKPVLHAHRAVWARRMMWDDWYDLRTDDRMLHAGALNWTYTLGTGLMDPWARGATALVHAGDADRSVWPDLIATHAPSLFAAAPGVLRQILESDIADLSGKMRSLRHVLSAGDSLPASVRHRLWDRCGLKVFGALGMSEVSTYVSTAPGMQPGPDGHGRPQRGRHVAVLGDDDQPVPVGELGELAVHLSDPGLMLGYLKPDGAAELPLSGPWFRTGDQATMDEAGWIAHHGRRDEVMNAGGYRVSPVEVETALQGFSGIEDVAVAAVPIREGVTIIAAFYVGTAFEETDISAYLSTRLARFKQPRAFVRVDELPRRGNGKLARKELPGLWTKR